MKENAKIALERIDFFINCKDKDSNENIKDESLEVGEIIIENGSF